MKKNTFKSEAQRIKHAAESHRWGLKSRIKRRKTPAPREQEESLKTYELIIKSIKRFERKAKKSKKSFKELLKEDAKVAYKRACKAQVALRERVKLAKKHKGDYIVDRAFGNPDKKGGFKPLTPKQYDAIIKKLSGPAPTFKFIYWGFNFKWDRKSADDLATSGERVNDNKNGDGDIIPRLNKRNYEIAVRREMIKLGPSFVGATPERQALTFMHEYIGHILGRAQDSDTVWKEKKLKGRRYLKYELDPTQEEIDAFYNQKGQIKRRYIGDTWAHAANEALKAVERAEQEKRQSKSAKNLRMPGEASEELPDSELVFLKKGKSGGQFNLRVLCRIAGPESEMLIYGWKLESKAPKNLPLPAKFGTIKPCPVLERSQNTGDICYNLLISTMLPQDFLDQTLTWIADPELTTKEVLEQSTATPAQPYGSDVIATLVLPDGLPPHGLFERDTPLQLKTVGDIFFADGPSKKWKVEFIPPKHTP